MKPYLQLPLTFVRDGLRKDLQTCEELQWTPHFNARDYSGDWSSIALRSASGGAGDIYSHPSDSGYLDTHLLGQCPYFAEVLDAFQCEKESARLLRLAPGSRIKEHKDVLTGYQFGIFRLHIPIVTSEQVHFVVGGQALPMKDGECWYADFSLPHHVENCGDQARVNLILDCKRNAWTDSLFAQAGYDFEAESRNRRLDRATRSQVIARLSEMKTDAAERQIRQLMAEAAADEMG